MNSTTTPTTTPTATPTATPNDHTSDHHPTENTVTVSTTTPVIQALHPIFKLPDELFDEIMSLATYIPMTESNYWDKPSHALTVIAEIAKLCRRFNRLITPYLYRVLFMGPGFLDDNTKDGRLRTCLTDNRDLALFCQHLILTITEHSKWSILLELIPPNVRTLWIRTDITLEPFFESLVYTVTNRLGKLENLFINLASSLGHISSIVIGMLGRRLVSICISDNNVVGAEQEFRPGFGISVCFDYSRGSQSLLRDVIESAMGIDESKLYSFCLGLWQSNRQKGEHWSVNDVQSVLEQRASHIEVLVLAWKPQRVHTALIERRLDFSQFLSLKVIDTHPVFLNAFALPPILRFISWRPGNSSYD
ncbi:hypothetical protein QBC43DRAFT_353320 [Cladorrhinum sp. PSN259]|nr:hypothetical protein QBC43DRAFT_353320 [Cladorrhinum sp. PSN259]